MLRHLAHPAHHLARPHPLALQVAVHLLLVRLALAVRRPHPVRLAQALHLVALQALHLLRVALALRLVQAAVVLPLQAVHLALAPLRPARHLHPVPVALALVRLAVVPVRRLALAHRQAHHPARARVVLLQVVRPQAAILPLGITQRPSLYRRVALSVARSLTYTMGTTTNT